MIRVNSKLFRTAPRPPKLLALSDASISIRFLNGAPAYRRKIHITTDSTTLISRHVTIGK